LNISVYGQKNKVDSLNAKAKELSLKGSYGELFLTYVELKGEYVLLKDTNRIVNTVLDMADVSRGGGSHSAALKILENLENGDYSLESKDLIAIYLIRGSVYYELDQWDESILWARKGLNLSHTSEVNSCMPLLYNLLGTSYLEIDTDSSLKYIEASINTFLIEKDSAGAVLPYINMARLYMQRNENAEAIKVLKESVSILNHYDVAIYKKMTYRLLAILYIEMKNYENGVRYMKLRDSVNNVINNSQIQFEITQFQNELESQRAENDLMTLRARVEIAEVKSNRDGLVIILGLILVVVLGLFLFFTVRNNRRIRLLNSELHQKADELEKLNRFKNRVLSVISHDMRAPLAQVITFQQAKNSGIHFSDDEMDEMDKTILASIQNSLLVLDNILKWANSQFNGMSLNIDVFDSFMSISMILNQVSQLAKEKDLSIITYADHIEVETDEALFQIVIRNLVSNAIKFSPVGLEIEVKTIVDGDYLMVSIKDQGNGISERVLDNLKTGGDIKAQLGSFGEKGAGIGLTLSQEFAKLINGSLLFKNMNGQGTEAIFKIPKRPQVEKDGA
jgi:signal transduction histidine kinase